MMRRERKRTQLLPSQWTAQAQHQCIPLLLCPPPPLVHCVLDIVLCTENVNYLLAIDCFACVPFNPVLEEI